MTRDIISAGFPLEGTRNVFVSHTAWRFVLAIEFCFAKAPFRTTRRMRAFAELSGTGIYIDAG